MLYGILKYLYIRPAKAAATNGTSMNSHNCDMAQSPTNIAWLILLAGFTEVFVTGILTRCISVNANPIAIPANPLGAFSLVEPRMIKRNINVMTNSVTIQASKLYLPGEFSP